MAVRSVIFDLGGVVLDWDVDAIAAATFQEPERRAAVRREVFDHADWLALDRGAMTEEKAVVRFSQRTGESPADMRRLMDQVRIGLAPRPDSVALLEELHDRGMPLYCLSNMHETNVAYLEAHHALFRLFRGCVYSAPLRMMKPEPAIYRHLLTAYALEPAESVFIDDSPPNVQAAVDCGMEGILFVGVEDCRRRLGETAG